MAKKKPDNDDDKFIFTKQTKSTTKLKKPLTVCLTEEETTQAKYWATCHGVSVSTFFAGLLAAYVQHEAEKEDNGNT